MTGTDHSWLATRSAAETARAGELLAELLEPGDVIALAGDLGAGKTCLVQGVARGLGVSEPVTSPTFNLLIVHRGRLTLNHFDLYRLEQSEQLEDLDFAGVLESGGVSLIEWGDRFEGELPPGYLAAALNLRPEDARLIEIRGVGRRHRELAEAWIALCASEGLGA
jgi:tRNA threonylcarbamoyladenosine biosynthesis protein TsaE